MSTVSYETTGTTFEWQTCGAGGGMSIGGAVGSGTSGSILFVDGSGNLAQDNSNFFWNNTTKSLGLGTTTPNQRLSLFASAADSAIEFSALTGSPYKWTAGIDYSDAGKFKISSSSALGTNDRFVIDGKGYVGIGSSTPSQSLVVSTSQGTELILNSGDNWNDAIRFYEGGAQRWSIEQIGSSNGFRFAYSGSTVLALPSGGSGNAYLTSGNSFSIGTTTTNQKLGIYNGAADAAVEFSSATGGNYKWSMGIDYSDAGKFKISSSSALGTSDRFVIDGNGYVGIGTASPTNWLTVYPSATGNAIIGRTSLGGWSGGVTEGTIGYYSLNTGADFALKYSDVGATELNASAGQRIRFSINAAEQAALTSNGRFAFGTTSANQKLSLYTAVASGDNAIEFSGASGATYKWAIGMDNGTGVFKISSSSALGTNDRLTIDGAGKVGINDATPDAFFDIDTPTTFTSGTIYQTGAAGATTLAGALTGMNLNLSTSYTATGQNVTGYAVTLPTVTNTAGTFTYRGLTVTGSAITSNNASSNNTFTGAFITNSNLTQTSGNATSTGVSVTTGSNTTGGRQTGFNVIATGVGAGSLTGINFTNITAGAGTENAINVGTGWDKILETTPFDIAGTGATTITPLTTFTTGTGISYAAGGATTLSGAYTGMNFNLNTSFTATGQSVTSYAATLPTVTNTGAGTYNYRGIDITGSAITQTTAAGVNTFTGAFITNSNLTQTTGTLTANGVSVTTGSNTTGGTQQGFNVIASGVSVGSLNGLNVSNITAGNGTERAIQIGTGWDAGIYSQTTGNSYFAGNLGIGSTTPWRKLGVVGTVAFNGLSAVAGTDQSVCIDPTTFELTTQAGTTCAVSAARYKNHIETLNATEGGLNMLMQLRPVKYFYNGDSSNTEYWGLIADEAASTSPQLAYFNPDGSVQTLNTFGFLALLTKSTQEINANLETILDENYASSTPASETFAERFFTRIADWLGDAANNIAKIYADRVETRQICVADDGGSKTCITKSQLDALLNNAGTDPAPVPSDPPPGTSGGGTTSSEGGGEVLGPLPPEPTLEPSPEPTPEPAPVIE